MFKYSNGETSNILKPSNEIIKWSNGEKYEKSLKIFNENSQTHDEIKNNNEIKNKDDFNKLSISAEGFLQNEFVLKPSKRELFNDKLSERGFYSQINQNPFLADSGRTYGDDIDIEENFLRPKSTSSISVDQSILSS